MSGRGAASRLAAPHPGSARALAHDPSRCCHCVAGAANNSRTGKHALLLVGNPAHPFHVRCLRCIDGGWAGSSDGGRGCVEERQTGIFLPTACSLPFQRWRESPPMSAISLCEHAAHQNGLQ